MAPSDNDEAPILVARQGSFMFGGTVVTNEAGDTFHGDHGYAEFQIPPKARPYPLVLWPGGGQTSMSWHSTPDGRPGYQTIFLKQGFAVYSIDQPRRGKAGRTTVGALIPDAVPGESRLWSLFRLGVWPDFFPNVQFAGAYDKAALEQFLRQQAPNTGPAFDHADRHVLVDAVTTLLAKIGPAILLTHSASGRLGWLTALQSDNIKAIVCYETGSYPFPEGEVPSAAAPHESIAVPLSEFLRFTRFPIQLVFGDNIPTDPASPPSLDQWSTALTQARLFVETVNRHGGDAELCSLPDHGIFGNTHFPFSDLNNLAVADQLSKFLSTKGLD